MFFGGRGDHRPPGPRGHILAGNLPAYERDRLAFFRRTLEEFGAVVRFGPRTTMLNSVAAAAPVLRGDMDSFAIRENFLQQRLAPAQGRAIAELRASLNPGLRPRSVGRIGDITRRRLDATIARLPPGGRTQIAALPVLEDVISTSVAEFYFGPEAAVQVAPAVGELLDELSKVIGNPFALPARCRTATRRSIEAKHLGLRMQIEDLLGSRRSPDSSSAFAAAIMASAPARFGTEQVIDMIIGSLLAAQRVPAAAASWLLMLLADHPEVQDELANHVLSGEGSTAKPAMDSTPAQHVVLESLRLYPPTWLIVRTSTRPVRVAGFSFPAGHHFMVSPYLLHRDPSVFHAPEEFRPQRWAELTGATTSYLPFGAGAHLCPGRHLASVVLATVATTLTRSCTLTREPGLIRADPRTTLLPMDLRLTVTPRLVPEAPKAARSENQLLDLADAPSF